MREYKIEDMDDWYRVPEKQVRNSSQPKPNISIHLYLYIHKYIQIDICQHLPSSLPLYRPLSSSPSLYSLSAEQRRVETPWRVCKDAIASLSPLPVGAQSIQIREFSR